jgi:hypothetical protein
LPPTDTTTTNDNPSLKKPPITSSQVDPSELEQMDKLTFVFDKFSKSM